MSAGLGMRLQAIYIESAADKHYAFLMSAGFGISNAHEYFVV